MPSNLKKMVRDRIAKTGESYQQALRHVRAHATGAAATPLEAIIRRLIVLAEARNAESDAQNDGPFLDVAKYLREPHPARDALRAALLKLDLATLRKIQAIMYAGRDDEEVLGVYQHLPPDSQPATASMISGKTSLPEYLREGLRLTRRQGVELDAPW